METDSRAHSTIRADFIGKELGVDRFTKDGITSIPPAARWRNNLSALSQHDNLFFIASNHVICVYQPDFPYRTLRRKPLLMILPELANPQAIGYISHGAGGEDGHCINHIVVGDLGLQEILLLATDSGNVVAYYISSIISAISRSLDNPNIEPISTAFGLRPFFSHWVYQSAWGLDIHTEGRMIAVSTNTPNEFQVGQNDDDYAKIVVFAFALAEKQEDGSNEAEFSNDEWKPWTTSQVTKPPTRDQSYIITLTGTHGHDFNIPNIQFVKEIDRDGGIWLMSTDIDGTMKMWQIWKANCVRSWDFKSNETVTRPWLHREFPGWSVAALDPMAFRYAAAKDEFTGRKLPPYYGYNGRGDSFDLSATVPRVAGNDLFHPLHEDRRDRPATEQQVTHRFVAPTSMKPEIIKSNAMPDADQDDDSVQIRLSGIRSPEQAPLYTGIIEYDADSPTVIDDPESDVESEGLPELPPQTPMRSSRRFRSVATALHDPSLVIPEFAILHCSNTHLRLLGSPKQDTPHIFCRNILRQLVPENRITTRRGLEFLHMERLNMVHKLEDIGAVLVATQTGRVAICAMTKRSDGLLGLRIDAIIPTAIQEQQGHRPMLCPLVGLAIAPVQTHPEDLPTGLVDPYQDLPKDTPITFDSNTVILSKPVTTEERTLWAKQRHIPPPIQYRTTKWEGVSDRLRPKPERYLVMLTYADLTVLTFEVWRSEET